MNDLYASYTHKTVIGALILECEIPGRCRSLKNNKQIIFQHGRRMIIPSKEYTAWMKNAIFCLMIAKGKSKHGFPLPFPIHVEAKFFYDRSPNDLDNALNSVAEVLQKACVILDDNSILSYDGSRRYSCSRGKSRTIIKVYRFMEETMADHHDVPKRMPFSKVGGQNSGGLKKHPEPSGYEPVHSVSGGKKAEKNLDPLVVGGKPKLDAWEGGNSFLGGKFNEPGQTMPKGKPTAWVK